MDTALDMLKWVVDAYHPQWCASDKCYRCAFCQCEFVTSAYFHDTSLHKLGCQWAQSRVWLDDAQDADALADAWPSLPELDGIDRFSEYPVTGGSQDGD